MADPTLLYGVGATKAGTSWLYRYLHDHDACKMPAVKEAHYWDTFDPQKRDKQIAAYTLRLSELTALQQHALTENRSWQVRNMDRRIACMRELLEVLRGDRDEDLAYVAWLMRGAEGAKLVGDITPNYATLSEERLGEMAALTPTSKFLFLLRDPIDRLWSHVRMQARRFRQDGEVYAKKANNILWRVVNAGAEAHIMERGDYPAIVSKLRRVVPDGRLMVSFIEELVTPEGLRRLCTFLGIPFQSGDAVRVHAGEEVPMRADLQPKVAAYLQDQYDWVAMNVGPLPARWQDNLQRAMA